MVQVKFVVMAAAALLVCTGAYMKYFSETTVLAIVNRSNPTELASEYYMPSIDRTTFTVNRKVWLQQIDIPAIFKYRKKEPKPFSFYFVNVTIFEKANFDSNENQTECIAMLDTKVSSSKESHINISPAILLKPDKVYEINVDFPTSDWKFMYKGTHEIGGYIIKKSFFQSIIVEFHQTNPQIGPPDRTDDKRKLSQGVIQRLYLKC